MPLHTLFPACVLQFQFDHLDLPSSGIVRWAFSLLLLFSSIKNTHPELQKNHEVLGAR